MVVAAAGLPSNRVASASSALRTSPASAKSVSRTVWTANHLTTGASSAGGSPAPRRALLNAHVYVARRISWSVGAPRPVASKAGVTVASASAMLRRCLPEA